MKPLVLVHRLIDPAPASVCNDITLVADVDGDGLQDVVIGAKFEDASCSAERPGRLVWYRNPGWERYEIGRGCLEAGGVAADVTGNGRPDIVAGEQGKGRCLYWWENPGGDAAGPWRRRLITDRFERYHDQAWGDVDGDGRPELVILSQNVAVLAYFDVPDDPTVEPWPEECCHVIHRGVVTEGLRIADVDGDGTVEILAGNHLFRPGDDPAQPWTDHVLIEPFNWARAALGDLDGDGHTDIVLSEAEVDGGRLVWLQGPDFANVHDLGDGYFNLHTLEVADMTGDGAPDIVAGEMHLGRNAEPALYVFLNDGAGRFQRTRIDCPHGIHEGKLIRLTPGALPSVVGKPYAPHNRVELWENVS